MDDFSETDSNELIEVHSQLSDSSSAMVPDESQDVCVLSQPFDPPPCRGERKRKESWKLRGSFEVKVGGNVRR